MLDLMYLAITIAFFLAALGYIRFCSSLQKGERKG